MKTPKKDNSQRDKFIAASREAGCDKSEEAFYAKLKALMTVKPMTQAQVKRRPIEIKTKNDYAEYAFLCSCYFNKLASDSRYIGNGI